MHTLPTCLAQIEVREQWENKTKGNWKTIFQFDMRHQIETNKNITFIYRKGKKGKSRNKGSRYMAICFYSNLPIHVHIVRCVSD